MSIKFPLLSLSLSIPPSLPLSRSSWLGSFPFFFIGSLGGLLAGLPLAVFFADLESCLSV